MSGISGNLFYIKNLLFFNKKIKHSFVYNKYPREIENIITNQSAEVFLLLIQSSNFNKIFMVKIEIYETKFF